MKPLLGPPTPSRHVLEARTALETSDDPILVAAAAMQLRDLARIIPTGGGLALGHRALPYATDAVLALTLRGFLGAPRRRRVELVHPRLFGGDDGAT